MVDCTLPFYFLKLSTKIASNFNPRGKQTLTANTTSQTYYLFVKNTPLDGIFNSLRGRLEIFHKDYTSPAEQLVLKSTYTINPLFFSSHYSEEKLNSQHSFSDNDAVWYVILQHRG